MVPRGRSEQFMGSLTSQAKRIFKEQGLTPKKWMGQNLLVDHYYLSRIVEAAEIRPGDPVVEIGAGLGVLTEALLANGAKVCALEVDAGFFRVLERKFTETPGVELVHADALKYDFQPLAARLGRLRVVANLPYNISSRLIFMFHEKRDLFHSLSILLQKEVAMRLIAHPGTKDYGMLTVLLGVSAATRILFDIPGRAFYPAPEVTSTLVQLRFPDPPPVPLSDPTLLTRLVKASFAARRKTLRNNLRSFQASGVLAQSVLAAAEDAGIDLDRRGESLSPEEFARFADAIHAKRA